MERNEIKKQLKKVLDKDRYEHTQGVMYTAGCLAMAYDYDIEKAMLAGLLHDCAKCYSASKNTEICQEAGVLVSKIEKENPALLHSKAGAIIANTKYKVSDPEILHAIRVHTTGEPDMSLLDKIIFVADYIEPKRNKAEHLDKLRQLAFQNIDQCVACILYDTLHYIKQKSFVIDPQTAITYEFYKTYQEEIEWIHLN